MKERLVVIGGKIKKLAYSSYFPLFFVGAVMLVLHFLMDLGFGDDSIFIQYLENPFNVAKMLEVIEWRYNEWSSRIFIETFLFFIVHYPIIWKILDTLIMVWIVASLASIFNSKKSVLINWLIVLLILAFPFRTMNSAGWIATTLNYSWPLAFGLFAIIPIANRVKGVKTPLWIEILSFPCLLFAANQEQMGAIMFAIYIVILIYLWKTNKKAPWLVLSSAIIIFASLIFILTCPGNDSRMNSEINTWFPDFENLSFLRKVELGYSSSLHEFIMQPNIVFSIFSTVLAIFTFAKCNKKALRVIACIPLVVSTILGLLSNITVLCIPNLVGIRNNMSKYGSGIQLLNPYSWAMDIILTAVLLCCLISLWNLFDDKRYSILSCFLVLLGLGSRMIMGFSPTIWASSDRTFIFMYFAFIATTIIIVSQLINKVLESVKIKRILIGCCIVFNVFILDSIIPIII